MTVKVPCTLQGIQPSIPGQNTYVQYHFIREVVEEGTVDMQKIHTEENLADVMTKAINTDKFRWFRFSSGLLET